MRKQDAYHITIAMLVGLLVMVAIYYREQQITLDLSRVDAQQVRKELDQANERIEADALQMKALKRGSITANQDYQASFLMREAVEKAREQRNAPKKPH